MKILKKAGYWKARDEQPEKKLILPNDTALKFENSEEQKLNDNLQLILNKKPADITPKD